MRTSTCRFWWAKALSDHIFCMFFYQVWWAMMGYVGLQSSIWSAACWLLAKGSLRSAQWRNHLRELVALLSEGDGERDTFWAVSGSSVSIPFKLYIYIVYSKSWAFQIIFQIWIIELNRSSELDWRICTPGASSQRVLAPESIGTRFSWQVLVGWFQSIYLSMISNHLQ